MCLSNNSRTTEARKIEHYDKVCRAQELGSYAQGQGSLAVFKVTARDQGHYKGFRGHLLHTVTFLVYHKIILIFNWEVFSFKYGLSNGTFI